MARTKRADCMAAAANSQHEHLPIRAGHCRVRAVQGHRCGIHQPATRAGGCVLCCSAAHGAAARPAISSGMADGFLAARTRCSWVRRSGQRRCCVGAAAMGAAALLMEVEAAGDAWAGKHGARETL